MNNPFKIDGIFPGMLLAGAILFFVFFPVTAHGGEWSVNPS